jgi:hypothetical protein
MKKNERRLEISEMLSKMGDALILEGRETKDGCIFQTGNTFHVLSDIISSEEDMFIFGELLAMFTAKKILDEMKESEKPKMPQDFISSLIASIKNISTNKVPNDEPKKVRKPRKKKTDNDESQTNS